MTAVVRESPPPRPREASPVQAPGIKVRRGDTLSRIAARYGIRARDIASRNGLDNHNHIRVGQTLRLNRARPFRPRAATQRVARPLRSRGRRQQAEKPNGSGRWTLRAEAGTWPPIPSDYSVRSANGTIEVQVDRNPGPLRRMARPPHEPTPGDQFQTENQLPLHWLTSPGWTSATSQSRSSRNAAFGITCDLQEAFFDRNEIGRGRASMLRSSGDSLWGLAASQVPGSPVVASPVQPGSQLSITCAAGTRIVIPWF